MQQRQSSSKCTGRSYRPNDSPNGRSLTKNIVTVAKVCSSKTGKVQRHETPFLLIYGLFETLTVQRLQEQTEIKSHLFILILHDFRFV